jgi:hypothetical protein
MKKRKREKLNLKKAARKREIEITITEVGKVSSSRLLCKEMTREYQDEIRHSFIWDEMVEKHGVDGAEELLKEFRVYIH